METEALGYESSPEQARALAACGTSTQSWEIELSTALEAPDLHRLLARVAACHELLRTRLAHMEGLERPVQVVGDMLADAVELRVEPQAGRSNARLRVPFALLDEAGCVQLVCDLALAARAELEREGVLQYADYAAYRNERIGQVAEAGLQSERLRAGHTSFLPFRGRVTQLAPATAARVALSIAPEQSARCVQLARTLGISVAELMLCAFSWLLRRHADEPNLALALDWQTRPEYAQAALGRFFEPLPLSLHLGPELGLAGLAKHVQERLSELLSLRELHTRAHEVRAFACGFRYVPFTRAQRQQLRAAGIELLSIRSPLTFCGLWLELCGDEHELGLSFEYATDRYDTRAIGVLADQLHTLLDALCAVPTAPLESHGLCSAVEQQALSELCEAPRLEAVAARRYARVAEATDLGQVLARGEGAACEVLSQEQRLSSAELSKRADAVASELARRGLLPGQIVAQLMPRAAEAVVGMLAILRAGGVYLPIDPALPPARVRALLDDAHAALVLAHPQLSAAMTRAEVADEKIVWMSEELPAPHTQLPNVAARDRLAYIIYTSGSTGQPKGVPITHAAALHSLGARLAYYPQPVERFLLVSPLSFDSSLAGLFSTLAQGQCLYVCNEAEARDPLQIAELLEQHAITHWLALPSLVQAVLPEIAQRRCVLKQTIVAGEACSAELIALHARVLPQARLYNEYGPTEAAVWSSVAELSAHTPGRAVTIGRAIPHARMHVLDAAGAPVVRGVPGEIHVAGPGLTPGYLNLPQLTAERFWTRSGERLYRTGDRAYLDELGECVFLGRNDGQIKLRGLRIELGEIEAALAAVSGSAHVVVTTDVPVEAGAQRLEPRLRAFVEAPATRPGAALDARALLRALSERLPQYMLPQAIEVLSSLPRTTSGKLDRRALQSRPWPREATRHVPPEGPLEKLLCVHMAGLLGVPHVGRHDDFFSLGGHSLLVVRLAHQLRAAAGIELRVGQVFEHPTVAQLASALARPSVDGLCELSPGGGAGSLTLFCFHESYGDVHHYFSLLPTLPAALRVLGVPLPRDEPSQAATLEQLVERYTRQVRAAAAYGPYALCGYSMGGVLAHAIAARLEAAGEQVCFLGLFDATLEMGVTRLSYEALHKLTRAELHPDVHARFDALSESALEGLRAHTAELDIADQLQFALGEFVLQHELTLLAPHEIIAATQGAMRNARRWLAGHQPPCVDAAIDFFAAEQSLAGAPRLIEQWHALTRGGVRSQVFATDHNELLRRPELHAALVAALPRAGCP